MASLAGMKPRDSNNVYRGVDEGNEVESKEAETRRDRQMYKEGYQASNTLVSSSSHMVRPIIIWADLA